MEKILRVWWVIALVLTIVACTKEKSVEKEIGIVKNKGSWSFTESGQLYSGPVDTTVVNEIGGVQVLTIEGADTSLNYKLVMIINGAELKTGEYISPSASFYFLENGASKFQSDDGKPDFKITIKQIDSVTVGGSFAGIVMDADGNEKEISSGTFTASL